MECYYIVISSAHLSNGHFRNIKGVFRGPLSKNGNKTLDYAEKENTIAKALEDLKANFYCELCDKQYYKHQEFDNHINSYDHAHKQRLKELKQREFARNVASKSRKDERKQEKALQRLHKLAELRKEAACAPGSGPMFRSTTVMVRDNLNEIPRHAFIDSSKKGQEFNFALLHSSKTTSNVTSVASLSLANNSKPDIDKLGDQMQGLHGHKVGFSFAFPKKASIKLESSAAAFYEYNDEASTEHGFTRRSRFLPGPCNLQVSSDEELAPSSEEKHGSMAPVTEKHTSHTEFALVQDSNEPVSEENTAEDVKESRSPVSHLKINGLDDSDNFCSNVDSTALPDEILTRVSSGTPGLPTESNRDEQVGDECTSLPANEECLSQHDGQEENDQNISSDSPTAEAEIRKHSSDGLVPANSEGEAIALPCKQNPQKRPFEPFVPVLNKHGSSILQWPSEMLIYTNTKPSISYSCNPLCFDFRSSKLNECLEKNKPQSNTPNSSHKTGSSQGVFLDNTDKSVNTDCSSDFHTHPSNEKPAEMDNTLANGYNPENNQDELNADTSQVTEKQEKHHSTTKCIQESSSDHKQQNKMYVERTHEKWFHKNRKRKRRRKLCHHHYEELTQANPEISPVSEQQNDCIIKHQKVLEECAGENEQGSSASDMLDQAPKMLVTEKSGSTGNISTSTQDHENHTPHPIWDTKDDTDCCTSSNNLWRRNNPISHRQSIKASLNSGRYGSVYSRAFCSWSIRRSSSSPDYKDSRNYPDEKYTTQTQPIKRAYNSLTDEPERSHRKRRHHMHSCSSDESSNAQAYFSEENLRQTCNIALPSKPKRKRRRKRAKIHHMFIESVYRDIPRNNIKAPKEVSVFSISPKQSSEECTEQTTSPSIPDYENNIEKTMQSLESQTDPQPEQSLSLENTQTSTCLVAENGSYPEEFTCSVSPASEHNVLETTKAILEEEEKNENVSGPEIQAPNKVPSPERNLSQPPPKAYLCHYEVAETVPQEKLNPSSSEWWWCNPGLFHAPPPLPFKEAHMDSHAFLTTEQILTPFTLPEHALLLPPENHDKFKDLHCEAYHQIMHQNLLASKMKLAFPPAAIQPSNGPLPPLPLQQPLCSTSITTIHHTVLQQHAAAAAAAAAASTFKVLQPHQFLSQVPALSRTPLPHLSVGPRLCPAGHTAMVGPPQLPFISASVLHPGHLAFPPLPHTLFPSLLSPHPAVIPLQPLF
ncbi:zinc finger protein 804A isoform X1 [Anolis carolinensis]|uniref:Zinc finger protein 804A n=1 Tax=Anolis carolinensis TaxID=28377 RepID=A0A803TBE1_ANOCA|nr:PREDICTED: zinc finger protein 804A isoform X1 [Anolis carolinensis]|eukprot:XP_003223961.1 PREDICTED: zinc finger protein 804A isoform X1 [Anolis carolinensis]